jgi:hypothetical protein
MFVIDVGDSALARCTRVASTHVHYIGRAAGSSPRVALSATGSTPREHLVRKPRAAYLIRARPSALKRDDRHVRNSSRHGNFRQGRE